MLKARIEICSHLVIPLHPSRFRRHGTTPVFNPPSVTLTHSGNAGVSWRHGWRQNSHANRNIKNRNCRNSGGKRCGDWNRRLGFNAHVTGAGRSGTATCEWRLLDAGLVPLGTACRHYPAIPHPLHFLVERMADLEKHECPFRGGMRHRHRRRAGLKSTRKRQSTAVSRLTTMKTIPTEGKK